MKKKFLLITGGTGGHVIPAVNFGNYLINKNIDCSIIVDKRGYKFIDNFNGQVYVISSSNLYGGIFQKILGIMLLFFGFIKSFFKIITIKPNKIISFGSYASFFPMLSCVLIKSLYKSNIYIHEQNSVLGKTNKFFFKSFIKNIL